MKCIETKIEINAPLDKVWMTLMAFSQWDLWNPISKANGKAYLDEELLLTMKVTEKNKKEMNYKAKIIELEPNTHFKFRAKMMAGFMFTNDKSFDLSEKDGVTTLVHKEYYSGLMVSMFWAKLESGVPDMLNSMNEALKVKLES